MACGFGKIEGIHFDMAKMKGQAEDECWMVAGQDFFRMDGELQANSLKHIFLSCLEWTGEPYQYWCWGAAFSEVEIDTLTGDM